MAELGLVVEAAGIGDLGDRAARGRLGELFVGRLQAQVADPLRYGLACVLEQVVQVAQRDAAFAGDGFWVQVRIGQLK